MVGFRYSDDPIADHAAYEAELARLEKLVPWCCKCKAPIMDDYYYKLDEERNVCAECLDNAAPFPSMIVVFEKAT